jgi:8-oxo-dGTP pyrophosphatase MutT (NUDIX family)
MGQGWAAGGLGDALRIALAAHVPAPLPGLAGRAPSAVCLPLVERGGTLETWIIRRPSSMRDHPGEWGFPGGKPEPADRDLAATAAREAAEELGLAAASIRIIGALAAVPVATSRFALHPFVGELPSGTEPRPNREVADILRAPLEGFFDGTFRAEVVEVGGWRSPLFHLPGGRIYGASAWALHELLVLAGRAAGVALPEPAVTKEIPWRTP